MKFEFYSPSAQLRFVIFFVVLSIGLSGLSIIISSSWIVPVVVGILTTILSIAIMYITGQLISWELPLVYEINGDTIVLKDGEYDPVEINLRKVWKIKFQNHKYRKRLVLYFYAENGKKMYSQLGAAYANKGWPQDKWQELFEELLKRCPDAKIVKK